MKLPENKLWDIDYIKVHEMVSENFVHALDKRYSKHNIARYDVLTIYWKPITSKILWFEYEEEIKPSNFIFKRSVSPSEMEGWKSYQSKEDYVELKTQLENHLHERHN